MRVDDAGARTWLLAAVAGWALLAWLLALSGMGGRIAPLADDPGLLKPIPSLPPSAANRLGPIGQYNEIAARPLFAEDRRPKPFSLQGEGDSTAASQKFDYLLTSVLITPGLQLAILQSTDGTKSERVKLGEAPESFPGWRLSALNARSAIFDGPGEQRTIELRVFDGTGGSPPTVVGRAGQPSTGMPVAPLADLPDMPSQPPAATSQPTVAQPTLANKPANVTPSSTSSAPGTGTSTTIPSTTNPSGTSAPATEQSQMEAIRQRIQARRAQLRQQSQPAPPPANDQ